MDLPGFPTSKKNGKRKTKHGSLLPSVRYELWEKMAKAELTARYQIPQIVGCSQFEVLIYVDDFRRRDLDNMLTSVLDMLVSLGILVDDDIDTIPDIRARGYRTEEAKTIIRIHEPKEAT